MIKVEIFAQFEKLQAAFIYNFAKYVEWPMSYKRGNFVIGVIGNQKLENELKKIARVKMVGTQKIEIIHVTSLDDIYDVHLLFVSKK